MGPTAAAAAAAALVIHTNTSFLLKVTQMKSLCFIGDDPIPTVSEQPVKILGKCYNPSLKDRHRVKPLHKLKMPSIWSPTPGVVAIGRNHYQELKGGEAKRNNPCQAVFTNL